MELFETKFLKENNTICWRTLRGNVWLLESKMKIHFTWIISPRSIVMHPHQTWCKWTRARSWGPPALHDATRKKQINCARSGARLKYHKFWSPGSTFQWCFYGVSYIGIFWGLPIELARPDGAVTFTSLLHIIMGLLQGGSVAVGVDLCNISAPSRSLRGGPRQVFSTGSSVYM